MTNSLPSPRSSLWSRFSRSVRNRQVLFCKAWSIRDPKCVSAPQKSHTCSSTPPAPDNPLIRPKKSFIPFNKRLSLPSGYHAIPTIDPEEEPLSGNLIIDMLVLSRCSHIREISAIFCHQKQSIVNSVVMYKAPLTQKSHLNQEAFHAVNLFAQLEPKAKSAWTITLLPFCLM